MRWLLSLFLGLIIAWIIVFSVNNMQRVSYYQADTVPGEIKGIDDPLVAVGLAQYPPAPSIMDSINQPVKAKVPRSSPGAKIESSDGFATPMPLPGVPPQMPSATPAPATSAPGPSMSPVSSPAPAPLSPAPSAPSPAPVPYPTTQTGSPFPSS